MGLSMVPPSRSGWPNGAGTGGRAGARQSHADRRLQACLPAGARAQLRRAVDQGDRERHQEGRRARTRLRPDTGRRPPSLARLWKLTRQRLGERDPARAGVPQHRRPRGGPSQPADPAGRPARDTADRPRVGNSYHVATLDNDADEIFAGSLEFVRSPTAAPGGMREGWARSDGRCGLATMRPPGATWSPSTASGGRRRCRPAGGAAPGARWPLTLRPRRTRHLASDLAHPAHPDLTASRAPAPSADACHGTPSRA